MRLAPVAQAFRRGYMFAVAERRSNGSAEQAARRRRHHQLGLRADIAVFFSTASWRSAPRCQAVAQRWQTSTCGRQSADAVDDVGVDVRADKQSNRFRQYSTAG